MLLMIWEEKKIALQCKYTNVKLHIAWLSGILYYVQTIRTGKLASTGAPELARVGLVPAEAAKVKAKEATPVLSLSPLIVAA